MRRPVALPASDVDEWLGAHRAWRRDAEHLVREVTTTSYEVGARIVAAQVGVAEDLDHHPILTLGYRELRVELWTHDRRAITRLDLDYAERFDAMLTREFSADVVS